jgi:hypothetical protein
MWFKSKAGYGVSQASLGAWAIPLPMATKKKKKNLIVYIGKKIYSMHERKKISVHNFFFFFWF